MREREMTERERELTAQGFYVIRERTEAYGKVMGLFYNAQRDWVLLRDVRYNGKIHQAEIDGLAIEVACEGDLWFAKGPYIEALILRACKAKARKAAWARKHPASSRMRDDFWKIILSEKE